jgi:hypothetical protein
MNVRNQRCTITIIILIFFSLNAFPQTNEVLSNKKIISDIFVNPVVQVLSDSLNFSGSVTIRSAQPELLSSWAAQNLTDSCLEKNFLVYSPPDSINTADYSIVISNPQVEITYRSAGRRWLFFKKGIERSVQGEYHLLITNKEHRVLLSRQITGFEKDVINEDVIKQIEDENLPFTKGTKIGQTFIKCWLEPIIITATTMTVVYLFYTLRSEK